MDFSYQVHQPSADHIKIGLVSTQFCPAGVNAQCKFLPDILKYLHITVRPKDLDLVDSRNIFQSEVQPQIAL